MKILCFILMMSLVACASKDPSLSGRTILELQKNLSEKQQEVEDLRNENQVLRRELESRSRRITRLQRKSASRGFSSPKKRIKNNIPGFQTDQELYTDMQLSMQKGELKRLIQSYRKLSSLFPDSMLKDKALFLVGDLFLRKEMYSDALKVFKKLESQYPASSKVPAAQLAKSKIYMKMSLPQQARAALDTLVNQYPGSPESQRATLELKFLDHLQKSE